MSLFLIRWCHIELHVNIRNCDDFLPETVDSLFIHDIHCHIFKIVILGQLTCVQRVIEEILCRDIKIAHGVLSDTP